MFVILFFIIGLCREHDDLMKQQNDNVICEILSPTLDESLTTNQTQQSNIYETVDIKEKAGTNSINCFNF